MKSLKKILSLILALMMLFTSAFALASCSDDGDNSGDGTSGSGSGDGGSAGGSADFTYTVYVKSGNKGIAGADVLFTNLADSTDKKLVSTDSNGRAKITTEVETEFSATVTRLPVDYRGDDPFIPETKTLVDGTATFTYTAVDLPDWTVTVLDPDGNAIAGVVIQMCSGSNCFMPKTTGEDGKVVFADFVTAEYHVQINSMPSGYSYPEGKDADDYYYFDGETSITITLSRAN
ncbi:MAG: hypothetical protein IJ488_00675 [Clostridia bacterium]|nr:hypothetical protein [Clostridia bacterium]